MRYKPRYTKPTDLLTSLGYSGVNRGYAREFRDRGRKRLHGLIEPDGTINLHEDRGLNAQHYTKRFSKLVNKEIKRLETHDFLRAPWYVRFLKRVIPFWT